MAIGEGKNPDRGHGFRDENTAWSLEQLLKADFPMLVTVEGIEREAKAQERDDAVLLFHAVNIACEKDDSTKTASFERFS